MFEQETNPVSPYVAVTEPPARLWSSAFVGNYPYEFTDWRDETCSWKTTCYLNSCLNPTDTTVLRGKDVIEFLSHATATNMKNFEVGRIKHGLVVDDQGRVLVDGVMMRTAEDEVYTYWMMPLLNFFADTKRFGDLDVVAEDVTSKVFLFQIGGPVSIDVVEAATGESFRDMKHLRFRNSTICGHPVQICRVGMAGSLAYEVHGNIEDAQEIYRKLWEVGQPLGMRRLGSHCYPMNHAENGFPQLAVHFLEPRAEFPGLVDYLQSTPGMEIQLMMSTVPYELHGSAGDSIDNFYHNPYELGWGRMIHFDHDFQGRGACEKLANGGNTRKIVSLEWNADDIGEVFADQFRGSDEHYRLIESPSETQFFPGFEASVVRDYVLNEAGEKVGLSFGRQNAAYFHRMISIAPIEEQYAVEGTELYVLWGDPGTKQFKIRATVARYPYNNVMRSSQVDVSKL